MCYMDMERNGWNVAVEEFMKSATQELSDSSGDKKILFSLCHVTIVTHFWLLIMSNLPDCHLFEQRNYAFVDATTGLGHHSYPWILQCKGKYY